MDINALYRLWLEKAAGHAALREELEAIRGDAAAIEDRFYRELEFGTGGLRGVIGAGTNRMNVIHSAALLFVLLPAARQAWSKSPMTSRCTG